MGTTSFKIGIDGGGTKTEFILVDETGAVIAERRDVGCSPSIVGRAAIHTLITENLRALAAVARQHRPGARISHTLFCMAGSRIFWKEFAAELTEFGAIATFDDSLPVLELATAGRAGLVLHSGTGSFVAARGPDGAIHFAGGLGWKFGDAASAYDLGRQAVARAILELQGWADASALGAAIGQATGIHDSNVLTRHFYAKDTAQTDISALAPHVTALAESGDTAAREILCASVRHHAELANTVMARVFSSQPDLRLPVGLSGAILQSHAARETLSTVLDPRVDLHALTTAPIEGVRQLLVRLYS